MRNSRLSCATVVGPASGPSKSAHLLAETEWIVIRSAECVIRHERLRDVSYLYPLIAPDRVLS